MARWGECGFRELTALQKRMEKLPKADMQKFMEDCSRELAARLLPKVIKRTPVGRYPKGTGRAGGTLRRGWTANTAEEAMNSKSGPNVEGWLQKAKVVRSGNVYAIYVINPLEYASYVEYGHRTANHKGWVEGRYMMTISAQELEAQAPAIIEKKLSKLLEDCFGGK